MEERIIKEGLANRVKNPLFVQNGRGTLTNQRFIYGKHSIGKILAIGLFINLTEGSYEFDIPLQDIKSIRQGRQGVGKTLVITTNSEDVYKFAVMNYAEWEIAFNAAIRENKVRCEYESIKCCEFCGSDNEGSEKVCRKCGAGFR